MPPSSQPATFPYRPELDSFRAIAVLLVIVQHWRPSLTGQLDTGTIGVTGFFVLSGFLITTILSRERQINTFQKSIKAFYLRRTFRIIPAYYVAVLTAWLLNLSYVRGKLPWFLLQGTNFLFFHEQAWGEGTGHFWTLAVEEQFYVVWPLVILLTPRRYLTGLLSGLIVLGPLLRWLLVSYSGTSYALVLLPASIDLFASGALLSFVSTSLRLPPLYLLTISIILSLLYLVLAFSTYSLNAVALSPSLLALASAALLGTLLTMQTSKLQRFVASPVLVFLGRISYSLYLYHLFLPVILHRILHHVGLRVANGMRYSSVIAWEHSPAALVTMLIGLLLIATLSWRLIEQPLKKLGRHLASAN
ncbi:acyltransferase [Hymenobacter sp. GOD-10R]|uniref:acyltransferase family protein n=1 Tax=Hymenobacter sp. GOD-10R TaxID=3093922 RepID=UPI002D7A0D1A|nr:acyltransferase [Hymenobacter sp. GOD-10R]WRQ30979.1 acyltransferase [Hymenobacter sp. GOD-10R]